MKDVASELGHRPRPNVWSRINVWLSTLTVAGVIILIVYQSLPWVREKAAQDTKIAEFEVKIDAERMLNKRLNREIAMLQTDPDFLGIYVRDRLNPGYQKDGETIFRFEPGALR